MNTDLYTIRPFAEAPLVLPSVCATDFLLPDHPLRQSMSLIVDSPLGTALHRLEALARSPLARHVMTVVVTFNLCVEHWEDLWDLQPDVLLVSPKSENELATALAHAADGKAYRGIPGGRSLLSLGERKILRYVAQGWCNKQIAAYLSLQEKTVMNTLTHVYSKLSLESRTQAVLYYWGLWNQVKSSLEAFDPLGYVAIPAYQDHTLHPTQIHPVLTRVND